MIAALSASAAAITITSLAVTPSTLPNSAASKLVVNLRTRLINVLENYFDDNVKARRLNSDGSYSRVKQGKSAPHRAQEVLFRETCEIGRLAENSRRTVFEPHRAS